MIDKLLKKPADCTGCYACYNVCPKNCISMEQDNEGFRYPHIDTSECIDCGLCDKVCPTFNKQEIKNNPKAFACMNKNEEVRLKSSSGGIFSILAEKIIDQNGVVFGAKFNDEFDVMHSYIQTKDQIKQFRGSKYVQSKIGTTFKEAKDFLNQDKYVLFSGTPCHISGLYSYLGKKYDKLICVDFICHGVPSPDIWNKYTKYRENEVNSKVTEISFRNKKTGWKKFSQYFKFANDFEYLEDLHNDLYMKAFLKNVSLRPSCYDCQFKSIHRESDITLGDFWGIDKVFPEMNDNKGISAIFLNSSKGQNLFNTIKKDIEFKESDISKVVLYNSSAIKSVSYNKRRDAFMKDKDLLDFKELTNKYCTDSLYIKGRRKIGKMIRALGI